MQWSDFSYVIAATGGWLLAQLVKVILSLGQDGLSWRDVFTSGGMPSSHVALVTTMMVVIGLDPRLWFGYFRGCCHSLGNCRL